MTEMTQAQIKSLTVAALRGVAAQYQQEMRSLVMRFVDRMGSSIGHKSDEQIQKLFDAWMDATDY